MYKLFIFILFVSCNTSSQTIVGVHDGDTFYTNSGKTIRLAEIDAPEYDQSYGIEARNYLASLVLYRKVKLIKVAYDKKWGRDVCEVYINGIWVNKAIVEAGYAWAYKGLSKLHNVQIEAKNAKKGMWISNYNEPPFKYRHEKTSY